MNIGIPIVFAVAVLVLISLVVLGAVVSNKHRTPDYEHDDDR